MNDITKKLVKRCADDLYQAHGQAFHLYFHSELEGVTSTEIPKYVAETIRIGESLMDYSINRNISIKQNFVRAFKVIDKIIDENENIIVVTEKNETIDV